jgi:O-6-methylguanine DNA methyltransferase
MAGSEERGKIISGKTKNISLQEIRKMVRSDIRLTAFQKSVLQAAAAVPRGKVTTYKILAGHLGKPGACRAVGRALNKNPWPRTIPCHRVIKSGGMIGGYRFGTAEKTALLASEGVCSRQGRVIDLKQHLMNNLRS